MQVSNTVSDRLETAPIIPLIRANDASVAVATARALVEGGLTVIEVVLRTEEALECVQQVSIDVPQALVGAGTVLSADQANAVVAAGAAFIVSPGLDEEVVKVAQSADLPVFPGIATASELQRARSMGLHAVKFFPAEQAGGTAMIKALGAVFSDMRFVPTGGVSAENLAGYLALPSVLACGGSWLTPSADVMAGRFDMVTRLAEEALAIAKYARNA